MDDWMSPLNRVTWMRAFLTKAPRARIRDGREFTIKYETQRFGGEMVEVAHINPVREFAPMGYLRMDKVTNKDWLTEAGTTEGPPGLYLSILDRFVNDKELQGVNVVETYGELKGRTMQTVRRGFTTAKAARGVRANHVKIVVDEGVVFMIKGDEDDD